MFFHKRHPSVGASPGTLVLPHGAPPPQLRMIRYHADGVDETAVAPEDIDTIPITPGEGITWVDVQGLGDEDIIRRVAARFSLHPLVLEDIVNSPQRPKFEPYDGQYLVLVRMLRSTGDADILAEQISILWGAGWVLTVQEVPGDVLDPVRARIRKSGGRIRTSGADYLAYAILDTIIDAYYPIIEQLGDLLEDLEDEVMTRPTPDTLRRLNTIRHTLLAIRRAVWPGREAVGRLLREDSPLIAAETLLFLRDTHDHCVQLADVVEMYREITSGHMGMYLSVVSNKTNDVMKVLTIMSTIFIPLTFLAGLYGMNFENIPELHWRWSYPLLLAVMVVIAAFMVMLFWRAGWLGGDDHASGHRRDRDRDAGGPSAPAKP